MVNKGVREVLNLSKGTYSAWDLGTWGAPCVSPDTGVSAFLPVIGSEAAKVIIMPTMIEENVRCMFTFMIGEMFR